MLAIRARNPREVRDRLRGFSGVETAVLFGEAVHALLAPGLGPDVVTDALARDGIGVLDIREISPSLEDVFLHLVSGPGALGAGSGAVDAGSGAVDA